MIKQTIPGFFAECVTRFPNNVYLWEKISDTYQPTTYQEAKNQVDRFAAGLLALGAARGDRAALLSEGRNHWIYSELGMLTIGMVNIPLSVKLAEPEEFSYRLAHSGARYMIVSGQQVAKVRDLCKSLPAFAKIILLDGQALDGNEITFDEVLRQGEKLLAKQPDRFRQACAAVQPDDAANICYTSGTTANPKGIILSHNNYVSNVLQGYTLMDIPSGYTTLLILPWDHAFAHTAGIYCMMGKGASLASVQIGKTGMETLKNIPINIRENRPHLLMSVPALAGNFKKNIEKGIRDKGPVANALFKHALKLAYAYNGDGFTKGKGLTFLYKPLLKLYDRILFSKIREGFGGRLEFFIGGGALLDIEIQKFFYAIGMPMFQGYGLTEASPIISSNSLKKHKLGSSGYLVQPLELKIIDDKGAALPVGQKGEICIKGPNTMLGYWDNAEATAEALRDGWLHTGDLGHLDRDGFLYVLGRFKSLLIADDGEKYSPEGIEEAFCSQSKYIAQSMLYNNQHPYTIALIVPDKPALLEFLRHKGLEPTHAQAAEEVITLLSHELNQYRKHGKHADIFPQRWLPAAVGVLPEGFTEQNHMLNSTMKMVRGKITERYAPLINFLYTADGKNMLHAENIKNIQYLLLN